MMGLCMSLAHPDMFESVHETGMRQGKKGRSFGCELPRCGCSMAIRYPKMKTTGNVFGSYDFLGMHLLVNYLNVTYFLGGENISESTVFAMPLAQNSSDRS